MEYLAPTTIVEALRSLHQHRGSARVLAGGTSVLPELNDTSAVLSSDVKQSGSGPVLIEIKRVPELRSVTVRADGALVVGAAVTCQEASSHQAILDSWPGLAEALAATGSAQIRSRATMGGKLCQAGSTADAAAALMAIDARCRVVSVSGERLIPVSELILSPGRTCLRTDELLASIELPAPRAGTADAYARVASRSSLGKTYAGVAVALTVKGDRIDSCRVALAAVTLVPALAERAASMLVGNQLEADVLARFRRQIAGACRGGVDSLQTADHKAHVASELAISAARTAWQRSAGSRSGDS
jgi:CO/xanthine dehydrogenase FAD-binding subunit